MRKSAVFVVVALVGMLAAAPMASAGQPIDDAKKACSDIVEGRAIYASVETGAQVRAQMDLGAAACKNVRYTMTVLKSETDSTVLATASGVPVPAATDGSTPARVEFFSSFGLAPPAEVCVIVTTSKSNGTVLDRAPDAGCVALPLDTDLGSAQRFR